MSANSECCVLLRGDAFCGPPMKLDGSGYEDSIGWGQQWGLSWGGSEQLIQPAGMAALPPSRFLGNTNLAWTPQYKDFGSPVRYSLSNYDSCSTSILEDIGITLTAYCHSKENTMLEFGAKSELAISPTTVTDEVIHNRIGVSVPADHLLPFANAPFDSTQPVTIEKLNTKTSTTEELIFGSDYTFSMFGIKTVNSLVLMEDEIIQASYSSINSTVMDGYDDCPFDCSLTIEAKNVAEKNCKVGAGGQVYAGTVGFFFPRVRLTPKGTRTMFAESFEAITMEGNAKPVWWMGREVRMRRYSL